VTAKERVRFPSATLKGGFYQGVAKSGIASGSGPEDRRFKSDLPDFYQDVGKWSSRLFWKQEIASSTLAILTFVPTVVMVA
jgi:hypothetical protein